MSDDLQDLVGFIGHRNPSIRATAVESLVPYSLSDPDIFRFNQSLPIRNLKVLVQDRQPIAHNAVTILINLSADEEVLELLASDLAFINTILARLQKSDEQNADLLAMLLANLAKWDSLVPALLAHKSAPPANVAVDEQTMNHLVYLFAHGHDRSFNQHAGYEYLGYLFADLSKHVEGRQYFVQKQAFDGASPLSKFLRFTEDASDVRRQGVASTLKNVAFDREAHPALLAADQINILPSIVLPLVGDEAYDADELSSMLPDLQNLLPDKQREADPRIIQTHVETLLLLTGTLEDRRTLRHLKIYPVIRETHLKIADEQVRAVCEQLVEALINDEKDDIEQARGLEDDEDTRIVEID